MQTLRAKYRSLRGRTRWASAAALAAIGLAGCAPPSDREREFFEERDMERQQREAFARSLESGAEEGEVLKLVQGSAAEDGEGTVEEWIVRQLGMIEGQVLFPRWEVRRRGASKYEVRYLCTVVADDHSVQKRGYSWNVDLVLRIVGPHSVLDPEDLTQRTRGRMSQQRQQKQARERFSLE